MGKVLYSGTLFMEFIRFAISHKTYWIIPLVLMLGLMTLLIVAGESAAPFIYTLF